MQVPGGKLHIFASVASTQDEARTLVAGGEEFLAVLAHDQLLGRGRFRREWHSQPGESLTMSIAFHPYRGHPEPWLVGMAVAVGLAGAVRCQIQWPNDLVIQGKKVGGILTELMPDPVGVNIPVVGIGINLSQQEFPDAIRHRATSLILSQGRAPEAESFAKTLLAALAHAPEPASWEEIAPAWRLFDATPGKPYRLLDGREATAIGIGPDGRLICSADGETHAVMAAEALFG